MFLSLRVSSAITAVIILLVSAPLAVAQGKLDARYTIAVAGISVGQASWKVDIGADRYTIAASGGASSWLKILVSGRGEASVQGLVQNGVPAPANYTGKVTSDDDVSDVTMAFEDHNVKTLSVAAEMQPDRIPVSEADRKSVMDPLTALVVPAGTGDGGNARDQLNGEVCKQKLAIFDGRRRFDLRLAFKRMESVKTERGYQGPAVVCAMTFHPISGHRPSSTLTKYLSEGRDMELWLAPIAGTHVAAPYRLTVANMIGSMTIAAQQWETVSLAKRASVVVGPPAGPAPRR